MLTGHLGHFEILGPLGRGGMGEVYRARDTRLDRAVAIKVLPPEFSSDANRLVRFEREARAIAALSHPHICTLHDIGTSDAGVSYLVMELLDGETLAQRLQRGAMPVAEALDCAAQVAEALAVAHRAGIVHRDLKPANVMLTRAGVKLLDFGLAERQTGAFNADDLTRTSTVLGEMVGTLPYMAPEQIEGGQTDARTDVYALGLLIVEMLTGRRLRDAASPARVIASALGEPVPVLASLVPGVPVALDRIVAGCLAREPDERWSSANDVLLQLRGLDVRGVDGGAAAVAKSRSWLPWTTAAAASIAAIVTVALLIAERRQPVDAGELEVLSILPPAGTVLQREVPQVSPDGRRVAFTASDRGGRVRLYVRDSREARPLDGTEDAFSPFWAPDSQRIGFFAGGQLKITSITSGAPRPLATVSVPRGGTWGADDVILFVPDAPDGVRRVRASGGPATPVPVLDDQLRWYPSFLPDGRRYLFFGQTMARREGAVWLGEVDSAEATRVLENGRPVTYAPPGYLLFVHEANLMAQRVDTSTPTPTRIGDAIAIAADVGVHPASSRSGLVSASHTDVLAFLPSTPASQLAWFDSAGSPLPLPVPAGQDAVSVCLSGNGTHAVFAAADRTTGNGDVMSFEVATGTMTRLTFDDAMDISPVCGEGDRIAFASVRAGHPRIFGTALSTPGQATLLKEGPYPLLPSDWPRFDQLVVTERHPVRRGDVYVLAVRTGEMLPIAATDADERSGKLSPDGRWASYTASEGGAPQVFVVPVPQTGTKWQVSDPGTGGQQATWGADGKRLYYLTPDRRLVAVEVDASGGMFAPGRRHVLFDARTADNGLTEFFPYAVSTDGSRVLINRASDAIVPITVMRNWSKALGR